MGWTLKQGHRTPEKECRLTFVVGCKGSGKTTYGEELLRQRIEHGRPAMWIDGTALQFFRSEFFSSCPQTQRFKFKLALFRWAVRRGLDVVVSTNNNHGTVEEVTSALEEETSTAHRHGTHNLHYAVDIHVIAARWSVCHDRVISRGRKGDSGPSSREVHKHGYLELLRSLRDNGASARGTAAISHLVLVDNNGRYRRSTEREAHDIVSVNWEVPNRAAEQLSRFLHSSLGDPQQFEQRVFECLPDATERDEAQGKLFVFLRGPPGAGKTTFWRQLFGHPVDFACKGSPLVAPIGLPSGPWYVIDGDCYCEQYRNFWQLAPGDEAICFVGVRRSRNSWKDAGLNDAFTKGANVVYPLTDDCTKARELQERACREGYAVQVWVLYADPIDVAHRLVRRNCLLGTPRMGTVGEFFACYRKIIDQYKADELGVTVWTFSESRWSRGITGLQQLLN